MDLELKCDLDEFENVRFSQRGTRGLVVAVNRSNEDSNILLSNKDVERLYEYLEEYQGKDKESVPEVYTKSTEEVSELLEMSFKCASEPSGTLYTHFDEEDKEVYIRVNNNLEWDGDEADVYLSSEDALTMAKNIIKAFENVGIEAEPAVEKPSLNVEEASSELQHNFYCATDDGSHLATGYDQSDNQLTLELTEDYRTTYIYLDSQDAMKLSESITKVFGTDQNNPEPHYMRPFKTEPVVEEYEAASKADLKALEERYLSSLESIAEERSEIVSSINRDYADLKELKEELKELKEDFRSSMAEVAEDWSKLNKDLNQVHVEISQIQNDVFNTNESNKVKVESIGKHIEGVSKEVVAAMEHLATRIDENGEEIQSLKVQEGIRKMKSRSVW